MEMTRRQRFYNTVTHGYVDRQIFDLCGCPQTLILCEQTARDMKQLLGIDGTDSGGYLDERILQKLDIDTRLTGGFPVPKSCHTEKHPGGFTDEWGIGYSLVGGHYEITKNPLRGMNIDEIRKYPFPRAEDIPAKVYRQYADHARYLHEQTDYVIVAQHPCYGVFELGCWMFGFDDFLCRCAAEPETVVWFFEKILSYQKGVIKPYYEALGRYIHCTTSGDDFGTQRGMFMSLSMFKQLIAPFFSERIAYTKSFTDAFFQHHTCGSVFELIPTLIQCGVDILNPIQPGAAQMEPEKLKNEYGDKLVFWGGIDTQELLVNGSVEEVKSAVADILRLFGNTGGYILSPAHCIQDDVPAANIIAIYDGAREFYGNQTKGV